jgi:polyferredoxin
VPLKVDVIRDRAAIAREVGDEVENVYRLQIMNTTEEARTYEIRVEGLKEIHLTGAGLVSLDGASTRMVPIGVRVMAGQAEPGTHPIAFIVSAPESPRETVREKSVFIVR